MRLSGKTSSAIQGLRKRGYSIPEISRALQVSKSTAFRYVQGVAISSRYYPRWLERRNASRMMSERNWDFAARKARRSVRTVTEKELKLIGAFLYWAEGSKNDFGFSNTDPAMVRMFSHILRSVFSVREEDLKVSLRIYEDLDRGRCLRFWSQVTGIRLTRRTSIDVLRGNKKGKLKYGMCRIRVRRGGLLLKELVSIIKQVHNLMFGGLRSSMD